MLFRADVLCVNALAHMDFFRDTTAILHAIFLKKAIMHHYGMLRGKHILICFLSI